MYSRVVEAKMHFFDRRGALLGNKMKWLKCRNFGVGNWAGMDCDVGHSEKERVVEGKKVVRWLKGGKKVVVRKRESGDTIWSGWKGKVKKCKKGVSCFGMVGWYDGGCGVVEVMFSKAFRKSFGSPRG